MLHFQKVALSLRYIALMSTVAIEYAEDVSAFKMRNINV